jgi:flagellar assembly protein FliH
MSKLAFTSTHAPIAVRVSGSSLELLAERSIAARVEAAFEHGRREAQAAQLASAAAALEAASARVDEARAEAVEELTETAITLGLEVAEQLLRRELGRGNYDLERIVRESLASSGVGRGNCTVHLHPDDFATLAQVSFRVGTKIEADSAVTQGDVHISTPQGLLVHETSQALESIRAALQAEFGR